ncbi:MAG: hypothetical protein V4654_13335 [Bdellovibrionota bacterium]
MIKFYFRWTIALLIVSVPYKGFSLDMSVAQCPVFTETHHKGELKAKKDVARKKAQAACDEVKADPLLRDTQALRCEVKCKTSVLIGTATCSWELKYNRVSTRPQILVENLVREYSSVSGSVSSNDLRASSIYPIEGHAFYSESKCGDKPFVVNRSNKIIWEGEVPNPNGCAQQEPLVFSLKDKTVVTRKTGYPAEQLLFYDLAGNLINKMELKSTNESRVVGVAATQEFIYVASQPTRQGDGQVQVFNLKGQEVRVLKFESVQKLLKSDRESVFVWTGSTLIQIEKSEVTRQISLSKSIPKEYHFDQVKIINENLIASVHTSYRPNVGFQNSWEPPRVLINLIDINSQKQKITEIDYQIEKTLLSISPTFLYLTEPDVVLDQVGELKKLNYLTTMSWEEGFTWHWKYVSHVNTLYFNKTALVQKQRFQYSEFIYRSGDNDEYIAELRPTFVNLQNDITIFSGLGSGLFYTKENFLMEIDAEARSGILLSKEESGNKVKLQFASASKKSNEWNFSRESKAAGCQYPPKVSIEQEEH